MKIPRIIPTVLLALSLPCLYADDTPQLPPAILELHQKAESGDAEAQYKIGELYSEGDLVQEDDVKATYWFKRAVEQGHIQAHTQLARNYLAGYGVDRTGKEKEYDRMAIELLNIAVEKGEAEAHALLAACYMESRGNLPLNLLKIRQLLQYAADNGVEDAARVLLLVNDPIEGSKGIFNEMKKAYDEGERSPDLLVFLAGCYMSGIEGYLPVDTSLAKQLYTEAAEQGNPSAQYALGAGYYAGGFGGNPDPEQGRYWLEKSADQGFIPAIGTLKEKDGDLNDLEELKKRGMEGDAMAQLAVGIAYYERKQQTEEDKKEAVRWLEMAAEQGLALAEYQLGCFYDTGELVEQNRNRAIEYWRKASQHGFTTAQRDLLNKLEAQQKENGGEETEEMMKLRSILEKKGEPVSEAAEREGNFLNDMVMVLCDILTAMLQKFA